MSMASERSEVGGGKERIGFSRCYSSWRGWLVVSMILLITYTTIYWIHHDKFIYSGSGTFYDLAAEVYLRLLTGQDLEGIEEYAQKTYGVFAGLPSNLNAEEKPLYVLYLALCKLFGSFTFEAYYVAGALCFLGGLLFLGLAFCPNRLPLFVLLGGLLLPPYLLFHAFTYEPHAPQVFLTCLAVFLYLRQRIGPAFFAMGLSIYAHPSSMPIFLGLWIHYLWTHKTAWRRYLPALLGSCLAWGAMEAFLGILFLLDSAGRFEHISTVRHFLVYSNRTRGDVPYISFPIFLKFSLLLCPVALVGWFWGRDRLHFCLLILPVLAYLVFFKFQMPGAVRVLLPLYMLGFGSFLSHGIRLERRWIRLAGALLLIAAGGYSCAYYAIVAGSTSLKREGPARIECEPGISHSGYSEEMLYQALKRFGEVRQDAPIVYRFEKRPATHRPNVVTSHTIPPYILYRFLSLFFSAERQQALGLNLSADKRVILVRERKGPL